MRTISMDLTLGGSLGDLSNCLQELSDRYGITMTIKSVDDTKFCFELNGSAESFAKLAEFCAVGKWLNGAVKSAYDVEVAKLTCALLHAKINVELAA